MRYRIAVGPLVGQRAMTPRVPTLAEPPHSTLVPLLTTTAFSLNAAVACGVGERDKLEWLCRLHGQLSPMM
jgi:hypothetical protein